MSKVLARLAPKTLVPTGEGFGGHLRLEQCDVAYALSGLPAGPSALLRAMWAGDTGEGNMRDLYLWAWQEAAHVAGAQGWYLPKRKNLLRIMSDRAVDEFVYPAMTMRPHCRGSGKVQPNQHNTDGECRLCNSTGKRNPTDEEMAAVFEVSLTDYRRVWLPRFTRIYAALLQWHSVGCRHVRRKLSEDE